MSLSPPNQFVPYLPGPKTGVANPKCYAAPLMNCSPAISGEHYISHALLRELSEDGVRIEIEGLSWLKDDEKKKLPTKRLESNILCKRHNEALAGLDSVAKRFFLSIDRIDKSYGGSDEGRRETSVLFNGHDIERWMLKTLCGVVYSGNSSSQTGRIENWKPNLQWLQILFGEDRLPKNWGLYALGSVRHVDVVNRIFALAPISNPSLGVHGSVTILNDKRFVLAMITPPTDKKDTVLSGHVHRPSELMTADGKHRIQFAWDARGQGGRILIHYLAG